MDYQLYIGNVMMVMYLHRLDFWGRDGLYICWLGEDLELESMLRWLLNGCVGEGHIAN